MRFTLHNFISYNYEHYVKMVVKERNIRLKYLIHHVTCIDRVFVF